MPSQNSIALCTRSTNRRRLFALWLCLCTYWTSATATAADATSMLEFLNRKAQWDQLVGSTFTLEGRISSQAGREMRMRGIDLKFVLTQEFERPQSHPFVRIVGQLERSGRDLQFKVTALGNWKSDSEVIRERLRQAGGGAGADVYFELADWAEERAAFYEDQRLREESRELRGRGVSIAQKRAPLDRPEEFYALLQKAREWSLPEQLRMDLLHNAIRSEMLVESRKQQPEYSAVLSKVRLQFPGSEQRLNAPQEDLAARYAQNPLAVYSAADEEQRVLIHRLLFIETTLRMIEREAAPDGSNGATIAAKLERLVPERPELAARHRQAELEWMHARVPEMSRTEVLEFRNRLRTEGDADGAARVIARWIEARMAGRRKGPSTDVDHAALQFDMAGDLQAALALVTSAMQVDPDVPGGAELLDRMGYGWHQSKAVLKALIPPPAPDPFVEAIQSGRILVGMSDRQASAAIGGGPESVVRLASQGRVTELWHYPSQRLTIQLDASRTQPQLRVSRVVELSARGD